MPFEYVDGPTSDVAFEAEGETLEEVFESSAWALLGVMYDRESVEETRREALELEGEDLEDLFHLFLSELMVIVEIENLFPKRIDLEFQGKNRLKAQLWGDNADVRMVQTVVKGVTYHEFSLEKVGGRWKAHVVLDI